MTTFLDHIRKAMTFATPEPSPVRVWLPDAYGAAVYDAQISKGAGHKYIKRVPVGTTKGGATRYRYYYEVQHGAGVHNEDHFVEGSAFKHDGGHFHVKAVDGDTLTIVHDETGQSKKVSRKALVEMLASHHGKALDAHKAKVAADLAATEKHGSPKQKARMRAHAAKWGVGGKGGGEAKAAPAKPAQAAGPSAQHKAEAAKIVAKVLPKVAAKLNPRMTDVHSFVGRVTEAARKIKGYYNSDHGEAVQDAAAEAWKAAATGGAAGDHIGDAARDYWLDHHAMTHRSPDANYAEHLATTKLKDMVDATTRSHFLLTGTKPRPGQGVTAPSGSKWTVDSYEHDPFSTMDTNVSDAKGPNKGMHRALGLSVDDAVPHVLGKMNEHELKAIAEQVKGPMDFQRGKFDGHIGEMAAAELKRRAAPTPPQPKPEAKGSPGRPLQRGDLPRSGGSDGAATSSGDALSDRQRDQVHDRRHTRAAAEGLLDAYNTARTKHFADGASVEVGKDVSADGQSGVVESVGRGAVKVRLNSTGRVVSVPRGSLGLPIDEASRHALAGMTDAGLRDALRGMSNERWESDINEEIARRSGGAPLKKSRGFATLIKSYIEARR